MTLVRVVVVNRVSCSRCGAVRQNGATRGNFTYTWCPKRECEAAGWVHQGAFRVFQSAVVVWA